MICNRVLIPGLVLLALGTAAAAQPAGEAFKPKDQGFSVRFPLKSKDTPTEKTQSVKSDLSDDPLQVYTATYGPSSSGDVYLVSSTKFPPGSIKPETHDALYDGVREGLKKDGEVQKDEKDLKFKGDGQPMREFTIVKVKDKEKTKLFLRFRVLIRGDRLYQVAVVGSDVFVMKSKDAQDFLDSFEVTK
jgi:hypothetical protein